MNSKLGIGALSLLTLSIIATPTFAKGNEKTNGGTTPQGKPFVYIGEQIEVIEAVQLSLQEQIDDLVGDVSSIEEHLDATEDAIEALQAKDAALQALIDANAGNITDLQGEITRLQDELDKLRTDMTTGDDILQSKIDTNLALIGVLQLAVAEFNTLQGQIDALKAENTSLRLAMEAGDLSLQSQIDSNDTLIANLQSQIDSIGLLESQIEANKALISGLLSQVNSLSISIDRYSSYMNRECQPGEFLHSTNVDGSYVCEVGSGSGGIGGFLQLRVVSVTTIPKNSGGNAMAECPLGSIMTGGGYEATSSIDVLQSKPAIMGGDVSNSGLNRAWFVEGLNRNSPYNVNLYSTAICLQPI
ncbi:coiled-coil domain-containing protein [Vibrio natriegens]